MKILVYYLFFLFSVLKLFAQTDTISISTDVECIYHSMDMATSKAMIKKFIAEKKINVQHIKESKSEIKLKFTASKEQMLAFNDIAAQFGYLSSKKENTTNNSDKKKELLHETDYLKKKLASYNALIDKTDNKDAGYITLWNEAKVIEEKIFAKEKDLLQLESRGNIFNLTVEIIDEVSRPENNKVSFINMPGFVYSRLYIENPKTGITERNYQGFHLKYLFTKGKTYATIGVFKSEKKSAKDSTTTTEFFTLGFGQDFYSRHLGRGSRKFFNLYSGYHIGGLIATGKASRSQMFFISPVLGLEIFKNKYVLVDIMTSYFVPLGTSSRYMRGFTSGASFNIVF